MLRNEDVIHHFTRIENGLEHRLTVKKLAVFCTEDELMSCEAIVRASRDES